MAREWEAEFIRRWEAGETTDAIAAALGIAEGTARSRAFTLQREGKLASRPKAGRRQRAVHNGAENSAESRQFTPVPVQSGSAEAILETIRPLQQQNTALLHRLQTL